MHPRTRTWRGAAAPKDDRRVTGACPMASWRLEEKRMSSEVLLYTRVLVVLDEGNNSVARRPSQRGCRGRQLWHPS